MRIIIACDQHWPMVSGVATASRTLARALADRGHEILVIAPSQTGKEYEEVDGNHRIIRTKSLSVPMLHNIRLSVAFQNKIKKIVLDFHPDIIHVHTPFALGLSTIAVGKKCHIPVVATNHVMAENVLENHRFLKPLARPITYTVREYGPLLYKDAQHIIMPTQSAIDMFNQQAIEAPMTPVSNGIDLSFFSPGKPDPAFAKTFGLPPNVQVVVYVGRLDKEKHIGVFVRALAHLRKEAIPVHGLIVGSGNDAEDLEVLADELGIRKHMTFTGRVSEEDKLQALRSAVIFAMPSPAELQSIATLEAMATGLPVVAVKAGALPELCVNGQNGYVFDLDDDKDMADKLRIILTADALRTRMGAASLTAAKVHDIAHVVTEFERIYNNVIQRYATRQEAADIEVGAAPR